MLSPGVPDDFDGGEDLPSVARVAGEADPSSVAHVAGEADPPSVAHVAGEADLSSVAQTTPVKKKPKNEAKNIKGEEEPDSAQKTRAKRGTAGTFQGRRPPKDKDKLQKFLDDKRAWEEGRTERLRPRSGPRVVKKSEKQVAYQNFVKHFQCDKALRPRERLIRAAAAWKAQRSQ